MYRLAPAAGVSAFCDPAAPILDRSLEILRRLSLGQGKAATGAARDFLEHKGGCFSLLQREFGEDAIPILFQWNRRSQSQAESRRVERGPFSGNLGFVSITRVVEGRVALQPESHASTHHLDAAHYLPASGRRHIHADGHVISNLGDPIRRQEPRNEDIRVRPIKLFASDYIGRWRDLEISAFLVIQYGGEDTRGVESRKTEPIN